MDGDFIYAQKKYLLDASNEGKQFKLEPNFKLWEHGLGKSDIHVSTEPKEEGEPQIIHGVDEQGESPHIPPYQVGIMKIKARY